MNHEIDFDQKNTSHHCGLQCHDSWGDGHLCSAGKQSATGIGYFVSMNRIRTMDQDEISDGD
jgi:hypothetical protein